MFSYALLSFFFFFFLNAWDRAMKASTPCPAHGVCLFHLFLTQVVGGVGGKERIQPSVLCRVRGQPFEHGRLEDLDARC